MMTSKQADPVIDEIRDVRERISARFAHDPERLLAYYVELQKLHPNRLIDCSKAPAHRDESAT